MQILRVAQAASTNSMLAQMAPRLDGTTALVAHTQSAGRGQRGNSWESAPGLNATFSLLFRPKAIMAAEQFAISMAAALAVADTVGQFTQAKVEVKWPNDIYVADRKICGILIENILSGSRIAQTIVGVGVNVNQREFLSDAPNPVSMASVAGHEFDLEAVTEALCRNLAVALESLDADPQFEPLLRRYRARQWRGEGYHRYTIAHSGECVSARIAAIAPSGLITMAIAPDDRLCSFWFKEISAQI